MPLNFSLIRKIENFDPELKEVLWMMMDHIEATHKNEFFELKEIVKELAEAQNRTEKKVEELAEAQNRTEKRMEELAEAQNRTEKKVEELAEAQNRTEKRMEELAEAQKQTEKEIGILSKGLNDTRKQVGGLSKSMAYALENEAFRKLAQYLKTHFQIDICEKFIRKYVGGEEINIFAKAAQNGEQIFIVGETVLKLDDYSKMEQLERKVNMVKSEYGQKVIPLMVTHFAHPAIFEKAVKQGVIVVQSFEWD